VQGYLGYVERSDPLHAFLGHVVSERLGVHHPAPAFRVFRQSGSNEVYLYEERHTRTKLICKFYGRRFGRDRERAAGFARREVEGLRTLRKFGLVGSPHHVIRPLGVAEDINCAIALEYYDGEPFSEAIARAARHGDDAHLRWRLTSLAYFLATQHNRTASGRRSTSGSTCCGSPPTAT